MVPVLFLYTFKLLKYFIHTDIDGLKKDGFFWSPPLREDVLHLSEWYCNEFEEALIYFDSWKDLKKKINTLDFNKQKSILKKIGKKHEEETLEKWKKYINLN